MSMIESEAEIRALREDLRRISPPYLLRKYEATEDEYEAITDEDLKCEYLDGTLIMHSPASLEHEERLVFLTTLLSLFVAARGSGRVYGSNAVMQLGRRRFCPDLSFLAAQHTERVRGGRLIGPMDVVMEMISVSTRDYDLGDKRRAYHEGCVPEIWLLDPDQKRFVLDTLQGTSYASRDVSSGRLESKILPGFHLDVSWLLQDPPPKALECLKEILAA